MTLLVSAIMCVSILVVVVLWDIPELPPRAKPTPSASGARNESEEQEKPIQARIACALETFNKENEIYRLKQEKQERKAARLAAMTFAVVAIYTIVTAGLWIAQRDANSINGETLIEANRAWVGIYRADHGILIPGQPMYVQLTLVNTGREPALRGNWGFKIYAIKYIPKDSANLVPDLSGHRNKACDGVRLLPPTEGTTIWHTLFHTSDIGSPNDPKLGPAEIPYSSDSAAQGDIDAALTRSKSLILDACFVYWSGNRQRQTSARFLLRDQNGVSPSNWGFNAIPSGNSAN